MSLLNPLIQIESLEISLHSILINFYQFYRAELITDLGYNVKFNLSDEATLADWKGWDLSQTKSIPDIDILLLAVRKVNILYLNSK